MDGYLKDLNNINSIFCFPFSIDRYGEGKDILPFLSILKEQVDRNNFIKSPSMIMGYHGKLWESMGYDICSIYVLYLFNKKQMVYKPGSVI